MTGIVLALMSVTALFGVVIAVQALARRFDLSVEVQRKLVHVAVGLHAIALPFFLDTIPFMIFAVFALAALLLLRLDKMRSGIGAPVHAVKRKSWGDVLFLVAVIVLFIRAPGDPLLYILPIAVLTLSDAAAAVVGSHYGTYRFGAGDRNKSIEGTVAFAVLTWILSVVVLLELTNVPRENVIWLSLFIASFSALVEADSWMGLDNLFIPIAIHTMCSVWGDADPAVLGVVSAGWLALLFLAHKSAPILGVSSHKARTGLVALFLTVATVRWPVFLLPIGALAIHLSSRRATSEFDHSAPDYVLTLALVGVFWLAMAGLGGREATAFYAASFVAVLCGYGLAFATGRLLRLITGIGAGSAALVALHGIVVHLPSEALWMQVDWLILVAATGCALMIACALAVPDVMFKRNETWRLGLAALPATAAFYLHGAFG